jgi:hypothetical protein
MSFVTRPFDYERVSTLGQLFSDEVEADPWVMFHGTSGYNARSIETNGFCPHPDTILKEAIQRIVEVFKAMKWSGEHGGGYAVLKPFSLDYDLKVSDGSPLFFAETGLRGLLYGCRDFAGGEKLRAVRNAIDDLERYLTDKDVRAQHEELLRLQYRRLVQLNAHPTELEAVRTAQVDLNWLHDELVALQAVRQRAADVWRRHDHGVVYALKVTSADLDGMSWSGSMGIQATQIIAASTIVEKVVVPFEYTIEGYGLTAGAFLRRLKHGLLPALQAASR